jgi:uncharacterized protein (DUF305 family)
VPRPAAAALSAALLILVLGGCSGSDDAMARPEATTTFTAGDVPVLVPGAPGEEPEVVQPDQSREVPNADFYGDADVAFVTDMVAHHAQALEMARLAPDRAADDRVRRLAARIEAGQGPEIAAMQSWLTSRGLPPGETAAGHGSHRGMAGMATPEEMTRLVAASGADFDRLFLELMTRHHEGALQMADDPGAGAQHPLVQEMVSDVTVTQSVEIRRMQELLAEL